MQSQLKEPKVQILPTKTRKGFLQQLSEFSRADWLIFIVNKSTDG